MSAEKVEQLKYNLNKLQEEHKSNLAAYDELETQLFKEKEKTTTCSTSMNALTKKHTEEKSNLQIKFNEEIDVLHAKHAAINQKHTKKINELTNEIRDLKKTLNTFSAEQKEKSNSPKKKHSQMSANKSTELELVAANARNEALEKENTKLQSYLAATQEELLQTQARLDEYKQLEKESGSFSGVGESLAQYYNSISPTLPNVAAPSPKIEEPNKALKLDPKIVEETVNRAMLKGRRFKSPSWRNKAQNFFTNMLKPNDYCSRHNNEESRCEDKKPDCVFVSSTEPLNKGDPNKCYDLTTYNFLKHRNVEEQYAASIKEFKKKGGNHKKSHTLKNKRLRPRSLRRHNTRKKSRA